MLVNEDGQGMVEYGLLLGLISLVCAGAILLLSGGLRDTFTAVSDALTADAG